MAKIGPEFITVGVGGKKIHNPAWRYTSDVFETKNAEEFNFKRLTYIYNELKAVLARHNAKFTYVGQGRGGPGNKDSFVAVSKMLVWNKNPREYYGANLVWINGRYYNAHNFAYAPDAAQDALLAGDEDLYRKIRKNLPTVTPSTDAFNQNPMVEIRRTEAEIRKENEAADFVKKAYPKRHFDLDFNRYKNFVRIEIQREGLDRRSDFKSKVITPLENMGWRVEANEILVPNGQGAEPWVRVKLYHT